MGGHRVGLPSWRDVTPRNSFIAWNIRRRYRSVRVNGTILTGRVGYSASYAVYVHDPRVVQKFKRPTAKKLFLDSGFEETREMIDAAIMEEMRL